MVFSRGLSDRGVQCQVINIPNSRFRSHRESCKERVDQEYSLILTRKPKRVGERDKELIFCRSILSASPHSLILYCLGVGFSYWCSFSLTAFLLFHFQFMSIFGLLFISFETCIDQIGVAEVLPRHG